MSGIFFEGRASGGRGDRPGLAKALAFLGSGDCLVVWKLDRLGRSCHSPRIRITDLLSEVAAWTRLPDCFTHLRTGEAAALLADGLNLGLTRMAEACSIASLGQLAWTADWHIREKTYALVLRRLVNQQQTEPFAAVFGKGTASSSDGQFFQAAGFGRNAGRLNAHYSPRPGFKVYTRL